MSFTKVIYFTLIFFSCYTTGNQKFGNSYLPDLKIKNVKSRIIMHEISQSPHGQPISPQWGLKDIEFMIVIENIGSGDWKHDLCVLFNFEWDGRHTENHLIFEDLRIPYASSKEIWFMVKDIFQKPNSVTFMINGNEEDSFGCGVFSEELFYNNNSYIYHLNK